MVSFGEVSMDPNRSLVLLVPLFCSVSRHWVFICLFAAFLCFSLVVITITLAHDVTYQALATC
jgi:hypothetical protein